jgi:DNA primase
MSMIPDEKVREVRARATIVDVVSEYVSLKKSGTNFLGLCPFHSEKTPSFNVNPTKEIFHCFGCGVGGDAFSFIMRIEGLTFPEAVKLLAKRVGVVIEERPLTDEEKRRTDERETQYRIIESAAQFYAGLLMKQKEGEPGRLYLERRNVTMEIAGACRLGFAPDRWDSLTRHLEQKRLPLDEAEKLGMIRRREGGSFYDLFRKRLLFPIADPQGHCIGFGGRVLDDSLPKYLNSPESPLYHKSEVLYGLDLAKQAIREKGAVFIVEGYFDHLALYRAGIKNVVATCGTALTINHVKLLKRYADKVYTLFDADSAGKRATFRAMELFLEENIPARVVLLPTGEDPDSFLKASGVAALDDKVNCSTPIFEYFFRDLCRQTDTGSIEGKVKILEELAPRLSKMANSFEQDLYIKEVSRTLGVEEKLLHGRIGRAKAPLLQAKLNTPKDRKKSGIGPEEMLLSLMGKYPEVAHRVREFGVENLFHDDLLSVAKDIISHTSPGNLIDWPRILDKVSSVEERNRLAALFVDDEHLEDIDAQKAFDQCRFALERIALKEMKALARELAGAEPGSGFYLELLSRIESLRNRKSRLI